MQSLIQQNGRLRQIMQKCEQQIIQLRKISQQHQQQIDNLLKFNQRLLSIIQNQMPNKTISRTSSGGNLQPIDQAANQKQHQLMGVNSNNININNNNHINHNNRYIANNNNGQSIQQQYINHNNNAMRERVEHLQREQVQHLKQQDKNYTHNHNENNNRNSKYNNSNINKTHNNQSPTMKINITKSTHNHNNRYYQNNNPHDQNNNPHDQNNNQYDQNNNPHDQNEQNHQLKFINTQSYSPRTDQNQNQQYQYYQQQHNNHKNNNNNLSNNNNNRQQQFNNDDNDSEQKQEGVIIYREQKQSLIDIPKLFKLQKGLNQHYHKQLFHSIEQHKHLHNNNKNYLNTNNNNYNNNDRKLSIPSQTSQFMGKISQAQTQRLQQVNQQQLYTQFMSIRQLINEYKQDFNLQQYLHLCQIIKDDLHNDIKQIKQSSNQRSTLLQNKHRQCQILKQDIMQFNPIDNIKSIMNRLNISKQTQSIVIKRVNNGKQYQNDNTVSNVSIMARKR